MRTIPILLSAVAVFVQAPAAKWCFVVAGDGRADSRTHRPEDKNGLNTVITSEIAHAVLREKAKFLMWTGDLVYGYESDPSVFEEQLVTWRTIMKPVYDAHIPILATRGNHEAASVESDKVWRKVFSGPYAMPNNGPANEKGLTFFYGKGNVLVIGLDQYTYGKEMVNQPWLDGVLKAYPKPFIFAMGHEPAFMDGSHKDTLDANVAARDAFWESLIRSGSRVFFAGHDHLYDHMVVVRDGPNPGPEMHQIVAGTSGAPFYDIGAYAGKNDGWKLKRVKHIDRTYGYVLVEIDGRRANITFKGRIAPNNYSAMDSFSYTVPAR